MPIDIQIARETAQLARLQLDDLECKQLAADLEAVLEHMSILDHLDTDEVEPLTYIGSIVGAREQSEAMTLRPDQIEESLTPEVVLAGAPQTEEGYFVVPAAISTKG